MAIDEHDVLTGVADDPNTTEPVTDAASAASDHSRWCQMSRMMTMPLPVTVQSLLSDRNSAGSRKGARSNLCTAKQTELVCS